MNLIQKVFIEYITLTYVKNYKPQPIENYIYIKNNIYDIFEITSLENTSYTFLNWNNNFLPEDPHYSKTLKPILLSKKYPYLDNYDEQILSYLLYTINTTLTIGLSQYSDMNVFIKHYAFSRLSQLSKLEKYNSRKKRKAQNILWWWFLFTHPVNYETLQATTIKKNHILYKNHRLYIKNYFHSYYNHFITYQEQYHIPSNILQSFKYLTDSFIDIIEKNDQMLLYPDLEKNELLPYVNDLSFFLKTYKQNKNEIFEKIYFTCTNSHTAYDNFLLSMLIQDYVFFVLQNNFNDFFELMNYFKQYEYILKKLINKIFSDTIFMSYHMRRKNIEIKNFPEIIKYFDNEAKRIFDIHV